MGLTEGLAAVKMDFLPVAIGPRCSNRNVKCAGRSSNHSSVSCVLATMTGSLPGPGTPFS